MKDWDEIRLWRRTQRAELVARRAAADRGQRLAWNERITQRLLEGFAVPRDAVVGFCWPYKDEFDARFAIRRWREQGAIAALPEVTGRDRPLQFRKWWPGAPMSPGVYDIPVPDGTEVLTPDIALVPMNGFDGQCYRLGYGGGYFDRTLAVLNHRLLAIGVTYEMLRLPTIYPQAHDIPMDFVVTEAAVYACSGGNCAVLDAVQTRAMAAELMCARRLPRAAAPARQGELSSPPCYAAQFPGWFGEEGKRD
jgi:5-formyltetrahydrofolate cyclo-ligase